MNGPLQNYVSKIYFAASTHGTIKYHRESFSENDS